MTQLLLLSMLFSSLQLKLAQKDILLLFSTRSIYATIKLQLGENSHHEHSDFYFILYSKHIAYSLTRSLAYNQKYTFWIVYIFQQITIMHALNCKTLRKFRFKGKPIFVWKILQHAIRHRKYFKPIICVWMLCFMLAHILCVQQNLVLSFICMIWMFNM